MLVGIAEKLDAGVDDDRGIMRTTNGGGDWTRVLNEPIATAVFFNPTPNPSPLPNAIAEVWRYATPQRNFAIFSTTDGATWENAIDNDLATPTPPFTTESTSQRMVLQYQSPSTVYGQYSIDAGNTPGVIFKSTDGGRSYSRTPSRRVPGVNSYINMFWVSPTDDDIMIGGGQWLWRSVNNGGSFQVAGNGYFLEDNPHDDKQYAVHDPAYNGTTIKRVYVGTDGGVYRAEDITAATGFIPGPTGTPGVTPTPLSTPSGWEDLNRTFQTTQFYSLAGDGSSGIIYGGTQDNGSLRLASGSRDADWILGGDGGGSAVAGTNCYGQTIALLHRTTDCGSANPRARSVNISSGISDYADGNVHTPAPIVADPSVSNRLLFGASSLWRSDNATASTPTWHEIKVNPTVTPSPGPVKPIRITAVAVAPTDSNIIWVGELDQRASVGVNIQLGRLYKTENGGAAPPTPVGWETIDDNVFKNPLPNRKITKILVDEDDADKVYVTLGGFPGPTATPSNIWRTTKGGDTWDDISGNLPSMPIFGVARHPSDEKCIFIGTQLGVWVTFDVDATPVVWRPVMEGPSNVAVYDISFMKGTTTLLVGTYGRGVWTTDVASPSTGNRAPNDFDADGRSDIAVVRHATPSSSPSIWYLRNSFTGYATFQWGLEDDQIVPADYNGDGKADVAVFRESDHYWYWINTATAGSPTPTPQLLDLGAAGDIAVPADYDGDGQADHAVFRPSTGIWYVKQSTNGSVITYELGEEDDIPVPADFDGDGKADFCVADLKDGLWYLHLQYTDPAQEVEIQFGLSGDIPIVGDYSGDGKADVAVWRPSEVSWYATYSENDWEGYVGFPFGEENDVPVPGDYDGDGKTDVAMWRPSDGNWYILQSTNGIQVVRWGVLGDVPVSRKTLDGINARPAVLTEPVPPNARPQRRSTIKAQP